MAKEVALFATQMREDSMVGSYGKHIHPIEILLWAMDQAHGANRYQGRKYIKYRSLMPRDAVPDVSWTDQAQTLVRHPELPIYIRDDAPKTSSRASCRRSRRR